MAIHKTQPDIPVASLCWGMAIATYPFFGKVAELVGRLSAIQGDCASAEVHRRMITSQLPVEHWHAYLPLDRESR